MFSSFIYVFGLKRAHLFGPFSAFDLLLKEFMHKAKAFSSKINNRVGPIGYNFHTQLQRFWLQLTDKKKMVILAYQ